MYPHQTEQMASQHQTEMREEAARRAGHRQARLAHRVRQASPAATDGHSHPVRRRAGYALISIGLRLAYAAGDN